MTEPFSLAATAIAQHATKPDPLPPQPITVVQRHHRVQAEKDRLDQILRQLRHNTRPEVHPSTEFVSTGRPESGSQLFSQRIAAIATRQTSTQRPPTQRPYSGTRTPQPPTYQQWRSLLAQEANQVKSHSQPLGIFLGDSLSQWFPSDRLPVKRLWLNQSISGDTTRGILNRLSTFAHTRPQVVYFMAGVNDLKNGASDQTIVGNVRQIVQRLRKTHPATKIVLQSILPTRSLPIPSQRIIHLNHQLQAIARQQGAFYLDVHSSMRDRDGYLHPDLTTDGIHLNENGYAVWQTVLQHADSTLARR